MIVMKFGGTSLGSASMIVNAAKIIRSYIKQNPIVVVSAIAKITDLLIELAKNKEKRKETFEKIKNIHHEILKKLNLNNSIIEENLKKLEDLSNGKTEIDNKALDHIKSFGERMSSKIVAEQLKKDGIEAKAYNSYDLGFITDNNFGSAEPLDNISENINENIKKINCVPVITGFLGKTEKGDVTTIGRGGSDYTSGIIGAAINAEEIQIWTDVDGIMSTDPKLVKDAKTLNIISFAEASELAYFGARVLHPKSILPAMKKNIPVRVLNTSNADGKGTTILNKTEKNGRIVKAIACKKSITLINVHSTRMLGAYGFLSKLFAVFEKYKKSIDVVSTSEVSVSLTVDNNENIDEIAKELMNVADLNILENKAIVCIIGEGMRNTPGVAGRTFSTLGKNKVNIEMISQGASEINVTFIVDGNDADKTVKILHKEYFSE